MSKSKFGDSNLYMTTSEFADLVVEALHEQNYFKHDDVCHPQDIAYAFTIVGETIGNAMAWAITQEHNFKKQAVMQPKDLRKTVLPVDEEIAPTTNAYSEWKKNA